MSKKSGLIKTLGLTAGLLSAGSNISAQELPTTTQIRANPGVFFQADATLKDIDFKAGPYFNLTESLSVSPYASYNLSPFADRNKDRTVIENRERELIGPGTYKQINTNITTEREIEFTYGGGIILSAMVGNAWSLSAGGGIIQRIERINEHGIKEITFTRNDEVLESATLENRIPQRTVTKIDPTAYFAVKTEMGLHAQIGWYAAIRGADPVAGVTVSFSGHRIDF